MLSMRTPSHERQWLEKLTLGMAASDAGAADKAETAFEQAIAIAIQNRLDDQLVHTYLAYGSALRDHGQLDKAEQIYRRGLTYNARIGGQERQCNFWLHAELGVLLFQMAKMEQAQSVLEEALKLQEHLRVSMEPEFIQLFIALACCYMEHRDWMKADDVSRHAHDLAVRFHGSSDSISLMALSLCMYSARGLGDRTRADQTKVQLRMALEEQEKPSAPSSLRFVEHMLQHFDHDSESVGVLPSRPDCQHVARN